VKRATSSSVLVKMRFRTLVALFVIMVAAVIVAASEEGANAAKLKLKPTSFAAKIKAAAAKAQKRKSTYLNKKYILNPVLKFLYFQTLQVEISLGCH
jgi:nitrate reductase cytochrome c-type subunit